MLKYRDKIFGSLQEALSQPPSIGYQEGRHPSIGLYAGEVVSETAERVTVKYRCCWHPANKYEFCTIEFKKV